MQTTETATAERLSIDVWADILCPWCYVGEQRLTLAIAQAAGEKGIDLNVHTFELNPDAPKTVSPTLNYMMKKYHIPEAQARSLEQGLARKANEIGLRFETDRPFSNTHDMLRLIHLGNEYGLGWDYMRAMQARVFEGHSDAFDPETLVRLGTELGLPEQEIRDVLTTDRYARAVREDHDTAVSLGVTGVPFTIIGRRMAIRGSVNTEDFVAAIKQGMEQGNA